MSWHEPGRDRDPWRGSEDGPPDLDEWFRRAWRRVRALFGRSRGPRGTRLLRLWWIVPVILVGIWLLTGFYRVPDSHQGVLQRFGAYAGAVEPGLHWYWPWPIGTHHMVAAGKDRSISQHARVLTRDGKVATARVTVAYRIGDPKQYLFGADEPIRLISALADAGLARVAREASLQTLRSGDKTALQGRLAKEIGDGLSAADTGITVQSVDVGHIELPQQVTSSRDKLASIHKQNGKQEKEARKKAENHVLAAERKAGALIAEAKQAARKREALAKVRLAHFKALLPAWRDAPATTRQTLRVDVLAEVLAGLPKVVVSGSVHSVTLPPLPVSAARAASATTAQSAGKADIRRGGGQR